MADRTIINLDLTASFHDVVQPTPFGLYNADPVFQADADAMVRFVYAKLGGRILGIEITNREVYAGFEEAVLEYGAMVNSYQAKSIITSILGAATGSLTNYDGIMPRFTLEQVSRQAQAYSSEALVGGNRKLYSASIDLRTGQQNYDLQVLLSQSGDLTGSQRIRLEQVFHFSPLAAYRFFDSNSAINYLNSEFKFESFTPETIFYMLPVWEDVLRQTQMKMSEKIRRSNYSWNVVNNVLTILPVPLMDLPLHITYYIAGDDPWAGQPTGVTTNLSNIPLGNINYSTTNAIGHQWMRRFAYALIKETLGQVRSKIQEIPIPNGTLILNGLELVTQGREEQQILREDLKMLLDSMTYAALSKQEMDHATALQKQLNKIPILIYVG
jgi:hypothetical protein